MFVAPEATLMTRLVVPAAASLMAMALPVNWAPLNVAVVPF